MGNLPIINQKGIWLSLLPVGKQSPDVWRRVSRLWFCLWFCVAVRHALQRSSALAAVYTLSPSQYLNIKLNDITIPDPDKYPHMVRPLMCRDMKVENPFLTCTAILHFDIVAISVSHNVVLTPSLLPSSLLPIPPPLLPFLKLSVRNCFIRGSVVRYVQLPADEVDTVLLQDATRKEAAQGKQQQTQTAS